MPDVVVGCNGSVMKCQAVWAQVGGTAVAATVPLRCRLI